MTEGSNDAASRIETWGYCPNGDARIFRLAPGEGLPDGWHASPSVITDPALATADALSARLQENERATAGAAPAALAALSLQRPGPTPQLRLQDDARAQHAAAQEEVSASTTWGPSDEIAAAIGATVIEGAHVEPLEYVLRRGYAAMGLPPALAAEMCRRLATLRIKGGPQEFAPAGATVEAPAQVEAARPPDPAAAPEPVQSGQPTRTREEAREAVRALLAEDLTDREIARRVGVSPSTVAAVRKASS